MKFSYLFYFCDGIGSVFESQVLTLLYAIEEKKVFKKIYLFQGIKSENQKNEPLAIGSDTEIKIVFFKSYPNYPFFNYHNRRSIQKALTTQRINYEEVLFHSRGEMIAKHLSKIMGNKFCKNVIPDVRGASVEETEEFYNLSKAAKSLKVNNNKRALINLNKFDKISVVSDSLKEYLVNNYQVDPVKIVVVPCLAGNEFRFNELQREIYRKEFKLSRDEILIVFSSGGTANWQNNDMLTHLAEKGLKSVKPFKERNSA